ncbi:hypothetical protein CIHG_02569 [Coccidioides immitis H538.4]|uniref:Uncharacterized protein n=1 Tax=Coccidioides immitis H538.4 TaxID=396776 RepID=A0A0J8RJE4_COCIT|nr:hypothetical protein CIHG_02569 [Coccidioides immitis H538.4]
MKRVVWNILYVLETPTSWLRAGSLDLGGGGRRTTAKKKACRQGYDMYDYVEGAVGLLREYAAYYGVLGRVRNLLRPPWTRAIFNSPLCFGVLLDFIFSLVFGVLLDFILSLSCGIKSNPGLNTTSHWRKSLLRSPPALLHEVQISLQPNPNPLFYGPTLSSRVLG